MRSTHGVNCTGSCSWKVYVKDGIITWESQQTDYPSVGPDSPGVRAARLPPRRRVLLVHLLADPGPLPVRPRRAGRDVPGGQGPARRPGRRRGPTSSATRSGAARYQRARGKGGQVRVVLGRGAGDRSPPRTCTRSSEHGPDRVVGFSPIPAMSMVSHAVGARFVELIGGVMTSFYDWYADLPVASPQVFGDQTDVPESGDWWNATYLLMWGSNVPVTRTPDAHWMAEARYRGQKVVAVSPDYADNTKFADEWLPAQPGTDGALAMAMGHVILQASSSSSGARPFFVDYVGRYTDLPFLVATERARRRVRAGQVPHRGRPGRRAARPRAPSGRPCSSTAAPASRWCPTARSASATPTPASAGGTSTSATWRRG